MPEPDWTTHARIDGLPAPSRKRRAETTKDGTMAEMVELFLGLPYHRQQDCSIGWGPDAEGHYGTMSASTIIRYVERKKLPPQMAGRYANAAAALAILLKIPGQDWHQRPRRGPIEDASPVAKAPKAHG